MRELYLTDHKIGLGWRKIGKQVQALSTYQALRRAYPHDDVEIIPFHGFRARKMPYKTFSPKLIWDDVKRFYKYSEFKKRELYVVHDVIIKDVKEGLDYIANRHYDVIYVGADTLLELDRVPAGSDEITAYWLQDIRAKKVIIAASSKNVSYEKLTAKQQASLKAAANQFAYIGVRDRATMALFEKLVGNDKNVEYIPDPTFTYTIDYSYINSYLKKKGVTLPRKCVFVQFYGDDYWLTDVAKDLKQRGYTMVTNRGVSWSDIVLVDMSPLEQIGLYKYMDFAITHRFHDGVFCLKNHTPALIYVKSARVMMAGGESKHVSLLKDFGLYPQAFLGALDTKEGLKNVWQSYQDTLKIFDKQKVEGVLEKNRKTYLDYLNKTKD